jgi:hypothetical protein
MIQARLKPYDPTKAHTARRIVFAEFGGVHFDEGVVVGPINDMLATHLRGVRMKDSDPNTPYAFDVLDEQDMKKLLSAEARQKLGLSPEVLAALRDDLMSETAEQVKPAVETPKPTRRQRAGVPA